MERGTKLVRLKESLHWELKKEAAIKKTALSKILNKIVEKYLSDKNN